MRQPDPIEILQKNIQILSSEIWNDKIRQPDISRWLNNFTDDREKLNALYLLSKLVYFGNKEITETLKALYRDKIKYPIIKKIRQENNNSTDSLLLNKLYNDKLKNVRILGVGNPSESGVHLLYMLRQINNLPKDIFINTHEIFTYQHGIQVLRNPDIEEYFFIDDICGSGTQAKRYSDDIVKKIKSINPSKIVKYIVLVATSQGLNNIIDSQLGFDEVNSIFVLDDSFKCFNKDSRYFKKMCLNLKKRLQYTSINEWIDPLGFKKSQLLLSFFHNTPNNTLPIFWFEDGSDNWFPIFKRYPKIYSL